MACEHAFVTSQGSPQTRFRRAIESRSVLLAELAAREMSWLPLTDALKLVLLYADAEDPKFERAACRWLGRLALERDGTTLAEAQLAGAALVAARDQPDTALAILRPFAVTASGGQ